MPVRMTHPRYGTRTVKDEQATSYLNLGWSEDGEVAPDLVAGSIADVEKRVGDSPQLARQALAAEQERSKPRTSLVTALARIAEPNTTSEV